jgi:hypothetical protein
VKIKTLLNVYTNLFAAVRMALGDRKSVKSEYTFDIKDVQMSSKDKPDSKILRLEMDGLKFFAHRTRTLKINQELVQAIFHPQVHSV